MKNTAILAATLVLSACTKEKEVTYTATCDRCYVWYQADDRSESAVAVEGSWNVFVRDTVPGSMGDSLVLDSTRVLGSWSTSVTVNEDAIPYIKARNEYGSTTTTIGINGATTSTGESMKVIELR